MKKSSLFVLLLCLGTLSIGCNKTKKKAAPAMEGTAAPATDAPSAAGEETK